MITDNIIVLHRGKNVFFNLFHMKYQYIISTQYLYYKLASKNMSVECKFITVQNNIGVLGGVGAGGALTPPGKNILLGRTELGCLAEKKLTV